MRFSGLCVGGPAAGRRVTCQGDRYRVAVAPAPQHSRHLSPAHAEVAQRPFTYVWVVGLDLGRENLVNFWVPEDRDVRWAVQTLLESYEAENAE